MHLVSWACAPGRCWRAVGFAAPFVVLGFIACLVLSPADAQQRRGRAGQATLTLTRVSGLLYVSLPATVTINGRQVASLWSGSSSSVAIAPGPNSVSVSGWSYPGTWTVTLNARPGAHYVAEISPRGDSIAPGILFGLAGGMVDAAVNKDSSGAFQMRVSGR
jgi:hypothetical protein